MDARTVHLPVNAAYDRWAAAYDAYDNPMVFMATRAVEAAFRDVDGASVFECGCGTGRNLQFLRDRGARVTGADFSAGMLSVAHQRATGAPLLQADITQELPVRSASFDVALFCLALEHVEHLTPPLREARRIVRPGGRMVIIEIHPFLSLGGAAAHFQDGGEEVHMPTFPHQFAAYLNAFADAGLTVERCREWRPRDVADPSEKVRKRGGDTPIAVEFSLRV